MAENRLARKLTPQEFEQLLQRAVERQEVKGSQTFTVEELVDAGQELGLDSQTVQQVYREHQQELSRPPARQRPHGSALQLSKAGDTFTLTIPPRLGTKVLAAVETLAFTAATGWAIGQSAPTPWIAGLGLATVIFSYLAIRAARTVRELRLNRDGSGLFIRFLGKKGKGIPLQAGQVHARLTERTVRTEKTHRTIPYLALDHGTDTYELLIGYSHAEQAWAVEEIERWLGR